MTTLRTARIYSRPDGVLTDVGAAGRRYAMRGSYIEALTDHVTAYTVVALDAWMSLFTLRPELVTIYSKTNALRIGRPVDQPFGSTTTVPLADGSQEQVTGPYFEILDEHGGAIGTMPNSDQVRLSPPSLAKLPNAN